MLAGARVSDQLIPTAAFVIRTKILYAFRPADGTLHTATQLQRTLPLKHGAGFRVNF